MENNLDCMTTSDESRLTFFPDHSEVNIQTQTIQWRQIHLLHHIRIFVWIFISLVMGSKRCCTQHSLSSLFTIKKLAVSPVLLLFLTQGLIWHRDSEERGETPNPAYSGSVNIHKCVFFSKSTGWPVHKHSYSVRGGSDFRKFC